MAAVIVPHVQNVTRAVLFKYSIILAHSRNCGYSHSIHGSTNTRHFVLINPLPENIQALPKFSAESVAIGPF